MIALNLHEVAMVANKYTEELTEWANKRKSARPRTVFLALKKDIQSALDSGFTMLVIWEHLQETRGLSVSYNTFTQYVARYIKNAKPEPLAPATQPEVIIKTTQERKELKKPEPKKAPKPKATGFKFNATPDKDELF